MTPIHYAERQERLRRMAGVDAVLIVPGANMRNFTGLNFHLSERPIIAFITPDGALSFIVPQLEVPQLNARPDLEARAFAWTDADGYQGAFRQAIEALGLRGKTLGVDGMTMRVTEWLALAAVDATLRVKPVERDLIKIRAIKTPDEIERMRRANRLSEAALDRLLAWVQPGMTERQIAARLSEELTAQGCTSLSFESLVQTGPNSALPHGSTTDRVLERDDLLLIDFGGTVDGYPADITRTFCLGTPTAEMRRLYDVVLAANEAAKAAVKPGVPMGAVDRAARDVIEAAGYGDYFIHRTGHGLGLDVHEPIPQIAAGVTDVLEPGMVFTIEPGIYIPGLGGVRIEDNVAVTADGVEVLTNYPRQLTRAG
ncbi:MAG: aminopeptidase P family protein [Chloroflexi bacterium]|nr:aminopeptidase P family protein [Chloroflexota bacterium]